ncbi:MAG: amidohydrolase [Rikenellaceae bacterium]|jgi:hippurate hydrolase|nr:amidohydrolase [Rikenellaceae bacterium]
MEKNSIHRLVTEIEPQMIAFRRELHRYPELSFAEQATCERIAAQLDRHGIPYTRVAGTGLLARIDGAEPSTRPVVLRADIDALPLEEETGLDYASENPGTMHACGHDIHATCLLGALIVLNRLKGEFSGTVLGLFQPGEERHPGGASLVLAEGVFDGIDPIAFIGQHVDPEIETGKFGFREGKYMASGDEVHFTVNGTGGHGGLPETLTDPVVATAQILTSLQEIVSRNAPPSIPTVLSFGRVIADGATNVIPAQVTVAGTLRTMDEAWRTRAKERIAEVIRGVCQAHGVTAEIDIKNGFPAVINDIETTRTMRAVAEEMVGAENVLELPMRMTAEDFGFYTQRFPSVFYRLGVAFADERAPGRLHSSTFAPNEEAIGYGIELMAYGALKFLA